MSTSNSESRLVETTLVETTLILAARVRGYQAMFWLLAFTHWLYSLKMDYSPVWQLVYVVLAAFSLWLCVRFAVSWWGGRSAVRSYRRTGVIEVGWLK